MTNAPSFTIDPAAFTADPYPDLAAMRARAPIVFVPQLNALLMTRRNDISTQEKRIEVFSSDQPGGLMTTLMGENMMRKDGDAHAAERKATFPAFSPRTVRDHWLAEFQAATTAILHTLAPQGACDLVRDFAMPVAGEALRTITGLTNLTAAEIDQTSQAMIDGVSNFAGDPDVEATCKTAAAKIDAAIDATQTPNPLSLIAVQRAANLSDYSTKANVKLAISGGQNEPRDAIAGTAWALLNNPDQLALIRTNQATWRDAFEEYARWISPIGMSPRRIAKPDTIHGIDLEPEQRLFFMFSSGNRDDTVFTDPDTFQITRDTGPSLSFGAGPHFCAGAAASRALIAEVALPMLFTRLPNLKIAGDVPFTGWAFRGPTKMPVTWNAVKI